MHYRFSEMLGKLYVVSLNKIIFCLAFPNILYFDFERLSSLIISRIFSHTTQRKSYSFEDQGCIVFSTLFLTKIAIRNNCSSLKILSFAVLLYRVILVDMCV